MNLFGFRSPERPPLVRKAVAGVDAMLATSWGMLTDALRALLDNEPLQLDMRRRDQEVNEREQEVRRLVQEHLALDPRREMVLSLLLVSAVQEAERLGDLAKNLQHVAGLAEHPRLHTAVCDLRTLRDRILGAGADEGLFAGARRAFVHADAEAARVVMEAHEGVKREVKRQLQALAAADDLTPNEAMVFALSAHLLGRVSAHLSNIASGALVPFDQIRRPAA